MEKDKMNFDEESVNKIISGDKVVNRYLVKEGEGFGDCTCYVVDKNDKIKWEFLKTYSVCIKGKAQWYCPDCRLICPDIKLNSALYNIPICKCGIGEKSNYKPLKLKITGISKERLLDVTDEEAKLEGYESKDYFIGTFYTINFSNIDRHLKELNLYTEQLWNPFVWRIQFEVVE